MCSVQWLDKCLNPCNYHHNEDIKYFHHPRKFSHASAMPISTSSLQRQPLSNLFHQRLILTVVVIYINWIIQYAHFVSGFFHSKSCFFHASVLLHLFLFHCFLWLRSIPLCKYISICLSMFPLMGIWVGFQFGDIINKFAKNEQPCTSQFVDICFHVFSVST